MARAQGLKLVVPSGMTDRGSLASVANSHRSRSIAGPNDKGRSLRTGDLELHRSSECASEPSLAEVSSCPSLAPRGQGKRVLLVGVRRSDGEDVPDECVRLSDAGPAWSVWKQYGSSGEVTVPVE